MSPDFFTDEFRNFKYLKSSSFFLRQYRGKAAQINKVQPFSTPNDPNFVWPHRVEFLEQLVDLHDDTVYLVYPDPMRNNSSLGKNDITLYEIVKPVIYEGNVLQPGLGERLKQEDIPRIEDITGDGYCLCSLEYFNCPASELARGPVFILGRTFLFTAVDYSAIFYNKETAVKYKDCLVEFLNKTAGAVSALSRLF